MGSIKSKIYKLLQPHHESSLREKWVDLSLTGLIMLNVLFLILETVPTINESYKHFFLRFEIFSVAIFTIEYFLRLWTITEDSKYAHPFWGRLKYSITPIAIFDLISFLPFE